MFAIKSYRKITTKTRNIEYDIYFTGSRGFGSITIAQLFNSYEKAQAEMCKVPYTISTPWRYEGFIVEIDKTFSTQTRNFI